MRPSLKIVVGLILVALLALVARQYWSRSLRQGSFQENAATGASPNADSFAAQKAFRHPPKRFSADVQSHQTTINSTGAAIAATSPGITIADSEWENRIDSILANESDDDVQKSRNLLALMPALPEDGQVEAVTHASNLTTDDQYAPLGQLLTNVQTTVEVLDVLMSDLANRTNTIKLSMYLQVARTAEHPNAEEAKTLLELYLEHDYGTNWAAWEKAVEAWLKDDE